MSKHACLFLLLASVPRIAIADVKFPFPVVVDMTKGKSGDYPNRIQDRDRGVWYVFVPGGKYEIGSDKLHDSKAIQVQLSGFYISESRVANQQAAAWIEKTATDPYLRINDPKFRALVQGKSLGKNRESLRKLTLTQRTDALLAMNVWIVGRLWSLRFGGPSEFKPSDALVTRAKPLAERFETGELSRGKRGAPLVLTEEERKEARSICAAVEKEIDMFVSDYKGNTFQYEPQSWDKAAELAKEFRAALPTEAQWEVAARLHQAKRIQLRRLFDTTLEWCSDYYAHDYFQRRSRFKDPAGPARGRLTAEQLKPLASSVGVLAKLKSRRFHVLRGSDAAARCYGFYADQYPNAKGVRLAFTP